MARIVGGEIGLTFDGVFALGPESTLRDVGPTLIRAQADDGRIAELEGAFELDDGDLAGGTVTAMRLLNDDGQPIVTVTEITIPVTAVIELNAVGDVQELAELILAESDVIHGTGEMDALRGGDGDDLLLGRGDDDVIAGEAGADELRGGEGDDLIRGGDGDDVLLGRRGDDLLIGDAGADDMTGGLGDDSYVVDDPGDAVNESKDAGVDVIASAINVVLPANVENGIAIGPGPVGITGNDLDNVLDGNGEPNNLTGGKGADRLTGKKGGDRLNGDEGEDVLLGGKGGDQLFGGANADVLLGGGGDDTLNGSSGPDLLIGGPGENFVLGGPGQDTVVFDSPGEQFDTIFFFQTGTDGDRFAFDEGLLRGFDPDSSDLSDYLVLGPGESPFVELSVAVDGGGDSFVPLASFTLTGITTEDLVLTDTGFAIVPT